MKRLHLLCNAHLDPMWLWEWEEGAGAALSTFRTAAALCEEFDGFVFNHNEALLYQWIEEYDPDLFQRIQRLVKSGKWNIMGGWYLQPDCNMPSGESFVRQIQSGVRFFKEKFGVRPCVAVNFDSFGHSRGLVQILAKSGYIGYLHCRPGADECLLPGETYRWVGYDGSQLMGCRLTEYSSRLGQAAEHVKKWIANHPDVEVGLVPWGVGDHGGGPSRKDIADIAELMRSGDGCEIMHSTPEQYFCEVDMASLPTWDNDLNPRSVGCYTSQIRIKQRHRRLENDYFMAEKMLSHAALTTGLGYPSQELSDALRDLMLAQFHDVLPGSSVETVETAGLRVLEHGLELVSRLKARAFFALSAGQPPVEPDTVSILAYNPHPFPVEQTIDCEFNIPDVILDDSFASPAVFHEGAPVPCQTEREISNVPLEFRKRVVFRAALKPSQMTSYTCRLEILPKKPVRQWDDTAEHIHFQTGLVEIKINRQTGLIDRYCVDGFDYLAENALQSLVINDTEDSWGNVPGFREVVGAFKLMTPEQAAEFSGVMSPTLQPVRIIEDGPVRTVVEALFQYNHSCLCQRYILPKRENRDSPVSRRSSGTIPVFGTEIEVALRVYWFEKCKMLKWAVPTVFKSGRYLGQVAYGAQELPSIGDEAVAQQWTMVVGDELGKAFTCVNDGTYGSDFCEGEMRLSLVRSPGYSAHPFFGRPVMADDRFLPRMDQGMHQYRFWLNGGLQQERLEQIDREALVHNQPPMVVSCAPVQKPGVVPTPLIVLDDAVVQMTVFKKAEQGEDFVVRLFEPTGQPRKTMLQIPSLGICKEIQFGPFEIKTLKIRTGLRLLEEAGLVEGIE